MFTKQQHLAEDLQNKRTLHNFFPVMVSNQALLWEEAAGDAWHEDIRTTQRSECPLLDVVREGLDTLPPVLKFEQEARDPSEAERTSHIAFCGQIFQPLLSRYLAEHQADREEVTQSLFELYDYYGRCTQDAPSVTEQARRLKGKLNNDLNLAFFDFYTLMTLLGVTLNDLNLSHFGLLELMRFRQDNGASDGEYQDQWAEDYSDSLCLTSWMRQQARTPSLEAINQFLEGAYAQALAGTFQPVSLRG